MKIKIRTGAFETNSSSSHSIVLKDNQKSSVYTREEAINDINATVKDDAEFVIANGIMDLRNMDIEEVADFGWGVSTYNDFAHKMLYALIDLYSGDDNEIENKNSDFNELVSFLKDFLGLTDIIYPKNEDSWHNCKYDFGNIDHQSQGTIYSLSTTGRTVKDFIIDKSYILVIDNDN